MECRCRERGARARGWFPLGADYSGHVRDLGSALSRRGDGVVSLVAKPG